MVWLGSLIVFAVGFVCGAAVAVFVHRLVDRQMGDD